MEMSGDPERSAAAAMAALDVPYAADAAVAACLLTRASALKAIKFDHLAEGLDRAVRV
jgi:hypothetical protein